MKRTFTKTPIIPAGYTGRDFNKWQKHLQKQRDKTNNTNLSTRLS